MTAPSSTAMTDLSTELRRDDPDSLVFPPYSLRHARQQMHD